MFDAIDAGNWASAQAGIAVFRQRPHARRHGRALYRQRFAGRRPWLAPGADRPGARDCRRPTSLRHGGQPRRDCGAAYHPGKADLHARFGAGPLQRQAGSGRACCRPAAHCARSADQGRRCDRRRSAAAHLRAPAVRRCPRRGRHSAWRSLIMCLGSTLDARRVADTWRQGATGEWASQAAWVSGLASWRLGD